MRRPTTTIEAPRVRRAVWPLLRDRSSVPQARRLVRTQLADWGLAEHSDVAEQQRSHVIPDTTYTAVMAPSSTVAAALVV
jgi:hypothetical protein